MTAVRSVARGDALIDPAITRRLIQQFIHAPGRPANFHPMRTLTARERDVLRQVAPGTVQQRDRRASGDRGKTVKTHVARILTKLGLRDRVQAVVLAYESGFVAVQR